jgi:hypothetical protein
MEADKSLRATRRSPYLAIIAAGMLAGIVAGALWMAFLIAWTVTHGGGYWLPARSIAALAAIQVPALLGGSWILVVGFLIHFAISIFFGVLFAIGIVLLGRLAFGNRFWAVVRHPASSILIASGLGLIYGVAIWAIMYFEILPPTDPAMALFMMKMFYGFYIAHVIFGLSLLTTPLILRPLLERGPQRTVPAVKAT